MYVKPREGREIVSSRVEELYPANLLPENANWTTNSASRVKSEVRYRAHESPLRLPIVRQSNSHTVKFYFLVFHFIIQHTSKPTAGVRHWP